VNRRPVRTAAPSGPGPKLPCDSELPASEHNMDSIATDLARDAIERLTQ
jgi:hypothetical protein